MSNFIENQNWRYATKKFDPDKKVSPEDLDFLKKAIRLSTSSYGLQPYKVLIIENPEIKEKLRPACWNQSQITDASQVIIFANILNFGNNEIDAYISNLAQTRGINIDNVQGYADFMKMKISNLTEEKRNIWTAKQTYLALGNLINAAAEMKIDVTPMEGFESEEVNKILSLNEKGLNASLMATIGYRHKEDEAQHNIKVRKPESELFITI